MRIILKNNNCSKIASKAKHTSIYGKGRPLDSTRVAHVIKFSDRKVFDSTQLKILKIFKECQ